MSLVKNTAQPERRDIFMKNGNESRDVLGYLRKRYHCPWAEIGKYWLGKEPTRLEDSLLHPLKKKNSYQTKFGPQAERTHRPVYGKVARKSTRPKSCCPKPESCCPKPESCCPKFIVISPEILCHVAWNFIECLNLKKSNILSKSQGINS